MDSPASRPSSSEVGTLLRLAFPVVTSEVAWMLMGIVDTYFVGQLGPAALGGIGLTNALFYALSMFGMGLLLSLDYQISNAFGAGRLDECRRYLVQGVWLALLIGPVLVSPMLLVPWAMRAWGVDAGVAQQTLACAPMVIGSLPVLLVFTAIRRYLQALGEVSGLMWIALGANVMNALLGYALIFGNFGAPALGIAGAGWATLLSRGFMLLAAVGVLLRREQGRLYELEREALLPDRRRLRELLRTGLPAAGQLSMEVGMFTLATALAGRFPAASLAAHHIAMTVCSFTFMVPLGVAQAGAVRVGHHVGAGASAAARVAGWWAIALGMGYMAASATTLAVAGQWIAGLFTEDSLTVSIATRLLLLGAVFQLFDGLQVVATGVLRGTGDTTTPMKANLLGNWVLGVPCCVVLAFWTPLEVAGLWVGLSVGLITVGSLLLWRWKLTSQRLIEKVG